MANLRQKPAEPPPLIVQELVSFGFDQGFARGYAQDSEHGREEGRRRALEGARRLRMPGLSGASLAFEQGFARGYDEGFEQGRDEGRMAGMTGALLRHGGRQGPTAPTPETLWMDGQACIVIGERRMPIVDRAFRSLAQARPDLVVAVLRAAGVELVPGDAELVPEDVDDPSLVPPPAPIADLVARVGAEDVLHVECQGYGETRFVDRLFRYHLNLVLRYPKRRIHTVALWLVRPPAGQRVDEVELQDVRVRLHSMVLCEVPADLLLHPTTACFAAGADAGHRTDDELCDAVVSLLAGGDDDARQKTLAVVLAAKAGRYHAMVAAMKRANVEPPIIIEDLVHFGIDEGRKEGRKEGQEEGRKQLATMLAAILATRGLVPNAEHQGRIQAQASLEQLRVWCERALTAASVDDVFTG
jgi:hypothetical protein